MVLVDGVKVIEADGWALVLPDPEEPLTHVWAEAAERLAAPGPGPRVRHPAPPAPALTWPPTGRRPPRGHRRQRSVWSAPMNVPDELRYSSDHEWARTSGGRVRVGITDYAQDALGDVVFVDLPDLRGRRRGGRSPRRGGVHQVRLGDLRPAGRRGRGGQQRRWPTRPRTQRRPLRGGVDLRDRPERPGRSTPLLDADRLPAADRRLDPPGQIARRAARRSGYVGWRVLSPVRSPQSRGRELLLVLRRLAW